MITTYTKRGPCPFTLELECATLPDILQLRKLMEGARDAADDPGGCLFFDSIVKQLEMCLPTNDRLTKASPLPGENKSLGAYRDRMAEMNMPERHRSTVSVVHEDTTVEPAEGGPSRE